MSLTFDSPADTGLLKALALSTICKGGMAREFGSGSARNLRACSRLGYEAVGYDVNPDVVEQALLCIDREALAAKVLCEDVLTLTLAPKSISVAIVGTTVYWPKSVVNTFLASLWRAINVNGILHIEFTTPRDGAYESEFCVYTCFPYPEAGYTNSFAHYCGYPCNLNHPGVIGASFWESDEVTATLSKLGKWELIHRSLDEWQQTFEDDAPMLRSFERVTVQKTS